LLPGAGAVFGWARTKKLEPHAGEVDLSGAAEFVGVIDAAVRAYLEKVDQGALVYPACKRQITDMDSDIRSVWAHQTRGRALPYDGAGSPDRIADRTRPSNRDV
jgi:hypothetical protein